jgi:Chaperone of endosialidase
MPADDLVLNVRQIAGYPPIASAPTIAALLMQLGIGGPYQSISPQALVATALAQGGDMAIAGALGAQEVSAGSAAFSNASVNLFDAQKAQIVDFNANWGTIGGVPIATQNDVSAAIAGVRASSVWSFNGRMGDVRLWIDDIICAGGAPIFSPRFQGSPRACTPPPTSNSTRLATTEYVQTALGLEFAAFAPLDSPAFIGLPTAPTPPQGSADGQLATTAFVANAVADSTAGVASFNGRTGIVALVGGDVTAAGGALLASPVFTGTPSAPTQPTTDNSTRLATTAFVVAFAAPLASPAFTGVPTAPTAPPSTSTTQLATTAFVTAAIAAGMTGVVTTFNGRAGAVNLIGNDVSAAGGALTVSPAFTGSPSAPTAAPGTSNTQLATCAFVMAAVATSGGVLTFNGRAGAVVLTTADVSAVGGALLASPALTGSPTSPTAAPGTNTTQLATCAFVAAAVAAATAGVASFNTRTGAVTLIATDVTAVLPASTVLPAINGVASAGTLAAWARGDHVHPVDTSRYAASNPSNFQTAAQVTASLANYLPLTGGTLTGALNAPWTIVVQATAATGGTANFVLTNLAAATAGSFFFDGGTTIFVQNGNGNGNLSITDVPQFVVNCAPYSPGGGSWNAISDARIKTVDGPYEVGLDEVLGLAPVLYRYKGNDGFAKDAKSPHAIVAKDRTTFVGLVAQEVEAVFPGMVTNSEGWIDGVKVTDFKSLNTTPLIYALVNAVKTLAARLTALEAATGDAA